MAGGDLAAFAAHETSRTAAVAPRSATSSSSSVTLVATTVMCVPRGAGGDDSDADRSRMPAGASSGSSSESSFESSSEASGQGLLVPSFNGGTSGPPGVG